MWTEVDRARDRWTMVAFGGSRRSTFRDAQDEVGTGLGWESARLVSTVWPGGRWASSASAASGSSSENTSSSSSTGADPVARSPRLGGEAQRQGQGALLALDACVSAPAGRRSSARPRRGAARPWTRRAAGRRCRARGQGRGQPVGAMRRDVARARRRRARRPPRRRPGRAPGRAGRAARAAAERAPRRAASLASHTSRVDGRRRR